jgi:hypothetical protein
MDDKIEVLLSCCSALDFGAVNLTDRKNEFYSKLNNEIILLCRSLPESIQNDALLFFMRYSRILFGEELNFFKKYYVPSWSIIYWLIQFGSVNKSLAQKDVKNAITAHSMAMLLHSLDDHLTDSEMPATHLALLIKSQSWMIMINSLNFLAEGVDRGYQIVKDYIDEYYSSICGSEEIKSLDSYCDLFRKQMATWLIVPELMIKKIATDEDFTNDIKTAYGSFGIAWRLLDDIKDIETDMIRGIHSAIYVCLPDEKKSLWDELTGVKCHKKKDFARSILNYVFRNCVIESLKKRICIELESAASIAGGHNMKGLADEFRCLLKPLRNG